MNPDAAPFVPAASSAAASAPPTALAVEGQRRGRRNRRAMGRRREYGGGADGRIGEGGRCMSHERGPPTPSFENAAKDDEPQQRRQRRRGRGAKQNDGARAHNNIIMDADCNGSMHQPAPQLAPPEPLHRDDEMDASSTNNNAVKGSEQQQPRRQRRGRKVKQKNGARAHNIHMEAYCNGSTPTSVPAQSDVQSGTRRRQRRQRGRQPSKQQEPVKTTGGTNHRKHKGKRRDREPGDIEASPGLSLNEGSFPSLAGYAKTTGDAAMGGETPWDEECLADRLASSLEVERRQQLAMQTEKEREQLAGVRLTSLTSRSLHEREGSNVAEFPGDEGEDFRDASATIELHSPSEPRSRALTNARSKWSGAEVSKMQERLWEAMKARRMQREEEGKKRRERQFGDEYAWPREDASSDTDAASDTDLSSSGEESPCCDYAPPTSPNAPFDEAPSSGAGCAPTRAESSLPLHGSLAVTQSILELEKACMQSPCPLHCAIYNMALRCNGINGGEVESGQSDAAVVLSRLLSMQDADAIRWKSQRVGLSDLRGNDTNDQCSEARVSALTDAPGDLLSADTTSLTPLQLAIYWNLPRAIRLLCTETTNTGSRHSGKIEEEDEFGRTPLMLACELGHASCIQALLCATSPKLDRRERKLGNTAFHFCCLGRSNGVDADDEALGCDAPACVEAIETLLRYTPPAMHKKALMLTNHKGQNVLHLACARGDLRLVECLLDQRDAPGVKIAKALDAKDKGGRTPFLAAVAADAVDVVLHLLTTRLGLDHSSWFAGSPLAVAASIGSVDMVQLLLGVAYDASGSYSSARKLPEVGATDNSEVNRALLEVMYRLAEGDEDSESAYEIIRLLIGQGRANPHLPVSVLFGGKLPAKVPGNASKKDTPLVAAVRAGAAKALRCMVDSYSSALLELKTQRRNDPLLRSQPESYFWFLEDKEDDKVHASVDAALVAALFLLWQDSSVSADEFGRCALLLYRRGRSNLCPTSPPRKLSRNAMSWLEKCLSLSRLASPPSPKESSLDGHHLEASSPQFSIIAHNGAKERMPYGDAAANFMDWSHVLADLPWFRSHSRTTAMNCSALQNMTRDSLNCNLSEDEFYLAAEGEKLLAHKSIVSARSGKLAAQIRFTGNGEQESPLSIHVEIPLVAAKMLLCHCYHGSIAFGLMNSPLKQCHQLLEMALVAEEYLCPSLLLECEIRLLAQPSPHSTKGLCICAQCCGGTISSCEQIKCPIQRQWLERAKTDLNGLETYCKPVGIYCYKTSSPANQSGLITTETALDVLAVAQQLEQTPYEEGTYVLKYCLSNSAEENTTMCLPLTKCRKIDTRKDASAERTSAPFAAAKMMAVWTMLRDFPSVIKSDSYLRHVRSNDDDGDDGSFKAQISDDDDAILLLRTCLEELASSPFNIRSNIKV